MVLMILCALGICRQHMRAISVESQISKQFLPKSKRLIYVKNGISHGCRAVTHDPERL